MSRRRKNKCKVCGKSYRAVLFGSRKNCNCIEDATRPDRISLTSVVAVQGIPPIKQMSDGMDNGIVKQGVSQPNDGELKG